MPTRPDHLATLRLAHGRDLANAVVAQVERPPTGSAAHPLTCAECGAEFLVDVQSLDSLSREIRPRRITQGLIGLGVAVVLLLITLLTLALPPIPIVAGILAGLAVIISLAHLAITPYYLGYALRRASDGKALPLPGPAGHTLF